MKTAQPQRHRQLLAAALAGVALCWGGTVLANETPKDARPLALPSVKDSYALGVVEYQVDAKTRVTGWKLNDRWYFGSQSGDDDGVSLVWQKGADRMSLNTDGIRFTRRF